LQRLRDPGGKWAKEDDSEADPERDEFFLPGHLNEWSVPAVINSTTLAPSQISDAVIHIRGAHGSLVEMPAAMATTTTQNHQTPFTR
jgi:hypothetical protein